MRRERHGRGSPKRKQVGLGRNLTAVNGDVAPESGFVAAGMNVDKKICKENVWFHRRKNKVPWHGGNDRWGRTGRKKHPCSCRRRKRWSMSMKNGNYIKDNLENRIGPTLGSWRKRAGGSFWLHPFGGVTICRGVEGGVLNGCLSEKHFSQAWSLDIYVACV